MIDFSSWVHSCCSREGHQGFGFAKSSDQVSVLPLPPPPPESGTAGDSLFSDTFFTWLHSTVSWSFFSLSGCSISLLRWFLLHFLTSKHWSDPGLCPLPSLFKNHSVLALSPIYLLMFNSQIHRSSEDCSPELQVCTSNSLWNISIWCLIGISNLANAKLAKHSRSHSFLLCPIS